ncbi:MAG: ATP-grasp domain-containing protein [Anaerolineales bacterium]|nr:ATP-grasp domain-containing protein [Anaerolineales bacterium]MCB8953046.1 ATP-grasp domain-containing protein [Ardenticatenales bacterium]
MFKKILIVNRGEIGVRVVRTCREMGIKTVAVYEAADVGSLHVRLADECVRLDSPRGFADEAAILAIARDMGVDAVHPGYGFLAEKPDVARACADAGITYIGPPPELIALLRNKIDTLDQARAAGFQTITYSSVSFGPDEFDALQAEAGRIGYPLVVKSCRGGRGRGSRLVRRPDNLAQTVRRARAEAQTHYGHERMYLEKAVMAAHQVGVQILGDNDGNLVHLGEREGSLIYSNQKVVEEAPAPCLSPTQREQLWETALALARLFGLKNAGTIEFLIDGDGKQYFAEIKPRLQREHILTEMITGVDLVREQIRLAAAQPLQLTQSQITQSGWAIACRISAEDPWNNFLPSPGPVLQFRAPDGPGVRTDTYLYSGCEIPATYDPLIAKLAVWGEDRRQSLARMRRALEEFILVGPPTNIPYLQRLLRSADFDAGQYNTEFLTHPFHENPLPREHYRDLAVAAALLHLRRTNLLTPQQPPKTRSAWHHDSRRLPG